MKVFITGANGFTGSAILRKLAEAGHEVMGLVQETSHEADVKNAGGIPIIGDLLVPEPWTEAVKNCDVVISASSPYRTNEKLSVDEAYRRAEAHSEMVGNLLRAASKSSVKAAVLTYHITAFGNQGDRWASEVMGISPVGLGIPIAGTYWDIDRMARRAGVPTIEVFPGWVYGPSNWFRDFLVSGLRAGRPMVIGAGYNYRSLIHIDDLAEGYRLILDKMPVGERFCLVDSHPVRQRELVNFVAREMGLPESDEVDYVVFAKEMGDILADAMVSSVRATNTKAKKELGFRPKLDDYSAGVPSVLRALGERTMGQPKAAA
ncbi:MAG TPA: NAD-dependent epimerase/dehydratase family protein [Nitrospirota bacterium]|jgi:nucleoside-diphosphate-sugar epimerase